MSKMTNVGDCVRCPRCDGEARVVWVSQDGKRLAIRCTGYHIHEEKDSSTTVSSYYQTRLKKKARKGMVFLIEATKK
ncbi:MAG: hypothetical protein OEY47_03565 [Candidatus Bathyarchaeota archaeon]|nr:hypothetical protein [Candidatus Bathyarchaeota archaeon]